MLSGKFRCIKSGGCDEFMVVGNVYEFINGVFTRENGVEDCNRFCSLFDFNHCCMAQIEPYIKLENPKHLTNSELWKLVENGLVKNDDEFKYEPNAAKIIYSERDGMFRWTHDGHVDFQKSDKWIKVESKPKLTKAQAEMEFGIEIVD